MGTPHVTFKWDGSYNRTHEFLQRLPRSYERERERGMRHFAINTLVDLQMRIQSGTSSPGLSDSYKTWKALEGHDPGVLVRTRTYYRNLKLDITPTGFSITPEGVEPNIRQMFGFRKQSELRTYEDIALWLEYGTKRMPARPHWGPTSRRASGKFPYIMGNIVQAAFDRSRQGSFGGRAKGFTFDIRKPNREEEE